MTREAIRFLILTDNHLGYEEKDPILANDSFEAFEELLQIGKERQVDAILHCGDLFHDNKPSRKTLFKTIELIRKYCTGDNECLLEYLSDPLVDFGVNYDAVNFQDPNYNISIPFFAIHGNHDDPTGDGNLSAWNILAATRLVNYFGKSSEVDDIKISPVLLSKGTNFVALYGLGNIRDERLHRTFLQKKVNFLHSLEGNFNWFNLLMFHQNRIPHGRTNYIPEEFLSNFSLNLILWGHEHESLPDPQYNPNTGFYVVQPGSSVATSLCEAESVDKVAVIVNIHNGKFEVEKVPLKSVRKFLIKDLVLKDYGLDPLIDGKKLTNFLACNVEQMLSDNRADQNDKIPLVRLRVDYSGGYSTINPQCFGQKFTGRIANTKDIIHFFRKKMHCQQKCSAIESIEMNENVENSFIDIDQVVGDYMKEHTLDIFPSHELFDKIKLFVDKDDKDAIEQWINSKLNHFNLTIKGVTDATKIKEEIHKQNTLSNAKSDHSKRATISITIDNRGFNSALPATTSQVAFSSDDETGPINKPTKAPTKKQKTLDYFQSSSATSPSSSLQKWPSRK